MNSNSSLEPDGSDHQQIGSFVAIGRLAAIVVEHLSLAVKKAAA